MAFSANFRSWRTIAMGILANTNTTNAYVNSESELKTRKNSGFDAANNLNFITEPKSKCRTAA